MNRIITNVDQKLLRDTKFPPEFNQRVDTTHINIQIIMNWAKGEVKKILGMEDDVVEGLLFGLIDTKEPQIKAIQIQLTGFLGKDAPSFCTKLWNLMLDAQQQCGVPAELLKAKVVELQQEKANREKAAEALEKTLNEERVRDRQLNDIRARERSDRGYGRGGGYGERTDRGHGREESYRDGRENGRRGGYHDSRDNDRRGGYHDGPDNDRRGSYRANRGHDRGPRRSRSPSPNPRRGSFEYGRRPPPPRETDSYVPSAGHRARGGERGERRHRSPSPRRLEFGRRNDSERDGYRRRDSSPYSRRRSSPTRHRRDSDETPPPRAQDRHRQRSRSPTSNRHSRRDVRGSDNNMPSRRKATPSSSEIHDAPANRSKDGSSPQTHNSNRTQGSSDIARRRSMSSTLHDDHKASPGVDHSAMKKQRREESSSITQQPPSETARMHNESNSAGASEEVGSSP